MVALVTGASSGIGEATALMLRDAGYTVYAVARRTERMADLAERGIRTFAMDLTDDATITSGVERILEEAGHIDLLVNNAGYGSFGSVEDIPIAEARRQFEVNVFGLARLIQLVTPGMRKRRQGRIVNISSIGGKIYEPLGGWYHATKFAVEGLSDCLRIELKGFGIRVVLVEPGPILTEWNALARESMLASSAGTAYEEQARSVARTLTAADDPRTGTRPEAVAEVIVRAATARRPRARYAAGKGAAVILAARKVLPDRAFDLVIARTFLR